MIGVLKDTNGNRIGFRLYDDTKEGVSDVSCKYVVDILKKEPNGITNIYLVHNKGGNTRDSDLIGYKKGESDECYPTIINGKVSGAEKVTIRNMELECVGAYSDMYVRYICVDVYGNNYKIVEKNIAEGKCKFKITNRSKSTDCKNGNITRKIAEYESKCCILGLDILEIKCVYSTYHRTVVPMVAGYNKNVKDVVIPPFVKGIGECVFKDCDTLRSIIIPGEVDTIGACALSGCVNLENVTINEGVKILDAEAFKDCEKLKRVTLPKSLEYLGHESFKNCINLEYAYVSKGTSFGDGAFSRCTKLKWINIGDDVIENDPTYGTEDDDDW